MIIIFLARSEYHYFSETSHETQQQKSDLGFTAFGDTRGGKELEGAGNWSNQ